MKYISTRDSANAVFAAEAIVTGISPDGGLFVPSSFESIDKEDIERLCGQSYPERAAFVMSKFLSDFSYDEILGFAEKAYSRFDGDDPCPLVNIDNTVYVLELWHGPTAAFKDMALSMLPHLMTASREKCGEKKKTLILVATSGDTGKAALEGFRDAENTDIVVFYPDEGVSEMQKLQMRTQEGGNVSVIGIKGNFDDAQTAVKTVFADEKVKEELAEKGYKLSSANSINWGRLVPQIAYYVSAYCDMVGAGDIKNGEKVNFCVPTGNFGNILAAYYAMRMGLPVNKLICASNINNILTDFFGTGSYDTDRKFYKTMSPSMDILISSNLERLLFEISGRDDRFVAEKMKELKETGSYKIDAAMLKRNAPFFIGGYADEEEVSAAIGNFYDLNDYLLDPHTGVAACVYDTYVANSGDETKTVIVSTASPYKFPADVYDAVSGTLLEDEFKAQKKLCSFTGVEIPEPLKNLDKKAVRFDKVIEREDIKSEVLEYVRSKKG